MKLRHLLASSLLLACGSESTRAPFDATDAGPSQDAGRDAASTVVCAGVSCRADQICLHRCSAERQPDGTCYLGSPPSGPEDLCVDLPKGCTDACGCLALDTQCPVSGSRTVLDCEPDGPGRAKCLCGCSF